MKQYARLGRFIGEHIRYHRSGRGHRASTWAPYHRPYTSAVLYLKPSVHWSRLNHMTDTTLHLHVCLYIHVNTGPERTHIISTETVCHWLKISYRGLKISYRGCRNGVTSNADFHKLKYWRLIKCLVPGCLLHFRCDYHAWWFVMQEVDAEYRIYL